MASKSIKIDHDARTQAHPQSGFEACPELLTKHHSAYCPVPKRVSLPLHSPVEHHVKLERPALQPG